MGPLTRGGQESLTDSSIKPAQVEEVILQVEMWEPLTEGMGAGCWETPKPQMSARDKLFELFIQKQAQRGAQVGGDQGFVVKAEAWPLHTPCKVPP